MSLQTIIHTICFENKIANHVTYFGGSQSFLPDEYLFSHYLFSIQNIFVICHLLLPSSKKQVLDSDSLWEVAAGSNYLTSSSTTRNWLFKLKVNVYWIIKTEHFNLTKFITPKQSGINFKTFFNKLLHLANPCILLNSNMNRSGPYVSYRGLMSSEKLLRKVWAFF